MPRTKRRKQRKFFLFAPSRPTRRSKRDLILNFALGALSLVLVAYIISFSNRYTRGGLEINTASLDQAEEPLLATQYYDLNPIQDIEIEVLNGCGESGLANKVADYLRRQRIDVVRSENADRFDYGTTVIIQRNENVDNLRQVAAALNIDPTDAARVLVVPDPNRDVDVTLIIGKDYSTIKPLSDFLNSGY